MINSMTAFATQTAQEAWGVINWEMRSVNHRFLDCNIKLPESLKSLEVELREILRQKLHRGRVECSLQYRPSAVACARISVNTGVVRELANACNEIKLLLPDIKGINPLNVLNWPGVIQTNEENLAAIKSAITTLFTQTIAILLENRAREGAALQKLLEAKLKDIAAAIQKIKTRFPEIITSQRLRLVSKLQDIQSTITIDTNRLEQEIVFFVQKIDICEEVERLATHVDEMMNVLLRSNKNDKVGLSSSIGKRLDFLLQEFNREANTIASKSVDAEVTKIAVDMKVTIEQMREQVQNIE